jgi:hypothetical protein
VKRIKHAFESRVNVEMGEVASALQF